MSSPIPAGSKPGLRDYLAAERTFLAWIRTGLALMGFGFVVARFGVFLGELRATEHALQVKSYGLSLWFGTTLIMIGVIVNIFSGWRYARLIKDLDSGETVRFHSSMMAIAIACLLGVIGLVMAVYLVSL